MEKKVMISARLPISLIRKVKRLVHKTPGLTMQGLIEECLEQVCMQAYQEGVDLSGDDDVALTKGNIVAVD